MTRQNVSTRPLIYQIKIGILVSLFGLLLVACGGGSSGSSPGGVLDPPSSERFDVQFLQLQLENFEALGFSTILKVELLVDNQLVGSEEFSSPRSFAGPYAISLQLGAGSHTLAFRIADQTSSPNLYAVNPLGYIFAFDNEDFSSEIIPLYPNNPLDPYNALLATGQSIEIPFNLQ